MKTIVTCAVTGAHTTLKHNPNLPITPTQIAESSLAAAESGAAVVHIHVRDPRTGVPSMDLELYQQTVDIIRRHNEDLLINLTTGPGATVTLVGDIFPESILKTAQERTRHVVALKPDICSLDFNTMNRGVDRVTINSLAMIKEIARIVQQAGVKPELEIFDTGDFAIALEMIREDQFRHPLLIQIATGVKWGWPSRIETVAYAKSLMPSNCVWYAFGVGLQQMPFVALSSLQGGHVRVGMEDNVFIKRRILAESNAQLVSKACRIIEDLGNEVATTQDAREILNLPKIV